MQKTIWQDVVFQIERLLATSFSPPARFNLRHSVFPRYLMGSLNPSPCPPKCAFFEHYIKSLKAGRRGRETDGEERRAPSRLLDGTVGPPKTERRRWWGGGKKKAF